MTKYETFKTAYMSCALWAETEDARDSAWNKDNFSERTKALVDRDCGLFWLECEERIEAEPEKAGHDFWLTRNGHGAGFWDGDWPVHGESLTAAAKRFGEVGIYLGDDGVLWMTEEMGANPKFDPTLLERWTTVKDVQDGGE